MILKTGSVPLAWLLLHYAEQRVQVIIVEAPTAPALKSEASAALAVALHAPPSPKRNNLSQVYPQLPALAPPDTTVEPDLALQVHIHGCSH